MFVLQNFPLSFTYTGPDLTYYVVSPKLKASIVKIDNLSGLFDKRYLAIKSLGYESSLYSYTFFFVNLLQNPISTIVFQWM